MECKKKHIAPFKHRLTVRKGLSIFTIPIKIYNHVITYGLIHDLVFTFRFLRWKYLTFRIRRLYFASQRKHHKQVGVQDEMPFAEDIVTHGLQMISEIKAKYANCYADRKDLRFMFHLPSGGAARFYFLDLAQSLTHTGISVRLFDSSNENLENILSDYRPTIFISIDNPFIIKTLNYESLVRYKKQYRLARLFVPSQESPLIRNRKVSKLDVWRFSLCREGMLADAFMSYFENEYWDVFCKHWKETGRRYYSIPFATNPLRHYPVLMVKDYDWGIAATNMDLGGRAALTRKYMARIINKYRGIIAGNNWGPNIYPVQPCDISKFYSQVKIAPNPAAESNVRYPLDCGAKVHELSAIGVFQIASENETLRKYYASNEVVGCRNPKEFNVLYDYFIDKPEVRHMYVMNALRRTLAENTYFHRIKNLIDLLDQNAELF